MCAAVTEREAGPSNSYRFLIPNIDAMVQTLEDVMNRLEQTIGQSQVLLRIRSTDSKKRLELMQSLAKKIDDTKSHICSKV